MGGWANNAPIVIDGLVFYVDAGNSNSYPGSGTTWTDLVGSNDGTLTNGPTYNSANGGSIVFDGVNDYGVLPNTSSLSVGAEDFTFVGWIYPLSWPSNTWSPVYVTGAVGGIWIGQDSSNRFVLRAYSVANFIQTTTLPATNSWTQIAITRIGSTVSLYYNASLQLTSTTSHNFVQNSTYIANDGGSSYFNGQIGNISLYKGRGLTSQEILQNYNALKSRFQ